MQERTFLIATELMEEIARLKKVLTLINGGSFDFVISGVYQQTATPVLYQKLKEEVEYHYSRMLVKAEKEFKDLGSN